MTEEMHDEGRDLTVKEAAARAAALMIIGTPVVMGGAWVADKVLDRLNMKQGWRAALKGVAGFGVTTGLLMVDKIPPILPALTGIGAGVAAGSDVVQIIQEHRARLAARNP